VIDAEGRGPSRPRSHALQLNALKIFDSKDFGSEGFWRRAHPIKMAGTRSRGLAKHIGNNGEIWKQQKRRNY
jgi:hypothetical protein